MKLNKKQKGFTLIELVITLLIVSVLSAFALPQFANLKGQATETMVDNLYSTVISASNTTFAEAVLNNQESAASGESISIKGNTINLAYGYPAANGRSLTGILNYSEEYSVSRVNATTMMITFQGKANCGVTYQAAQSTTDEPTLAKVKTGC